METSHPHSVEHAAHTNRRPSAWAPLRRPLFRALWVATVANAALAVDREGPAKYQKLRYEEDYRYLQDPSKRTDWFDPLKYVPLIEDGEAYLSLGGLIRERYEYIHSPLWGQDPQDKRGVFLQRYMLHADVHVGTYVRVFSQLHSALESGRRGGPSPVDEDKLDLQQAFLDIATLEVLQPLTLTADWNFYWRQSVEDGIYEPSGNLIRSPEGSDSRYVGSAISLTADWQLNRHLNLTTIYAHFFPGSFLRETGSAEPIDFVEFTLSLPF